MTDETMTGETTGVDAVDAPMTNDQPAVDGADARGGADATADVPATANTDDDTATAAGADADAPHVEPLTATYERLRHSTDAAELHEFARRPLPDRGEQAAFSRATALLEAVAGNPHTPEEDRVFLASTMPFPNVLVKLSEDASPAVREAVAANADDKNWLVGRLTKDGIPAVRDEALRNKRTSWKMRLEGAQDPDMDVDTLDFLSRLGAELEPDANVVLSSMVRRAVALNPNASQEILERLSTDSSDEVVHAARRRLAQ
ncbi:AbrB family transcriptional regulator [Bifidobacterium italicum]|uniref:AbrB family transcriptional regulator n=2 Tax=Bifidobacterium italicum TaxID=1960968 RepID=A0A2A2ELS9_9BIFI|nr:AbrB family transcriptional regulator [Bifidobacterium italicum]PAU70154.1 AbrB family transcriptional regulator [Bifidobacterium italicum]